MTKVTDQVSDQEATTAPPARRRDGLRAGVTATLVAVPVAVLTWVAVSFFGDSAPHKPATPAVTSAPRPASSAPVTLTGAAAVALPAGATATACRALLADLPPLLDSLPERPVGPVAAAERAAAWGDPAVVLTCGVGVPPVPRGITTVYQIDGASWIVVDRPGDAVGYALVGRRVAVRVDVPAERADESLSKFITPLAAPVRKALP